MARHRAGRRRGHGTEHHLSGRERERLWDRCRGTRIDVLAGHTAAREPAADPAPIILRPPVRCASTGSPSAPPLPSVDEQNGKRWVTAGRSSGSCDASSATFALRGIDTRLAWRSDADSFVALVVDAVRGTDASAGFADAQCTGTCSEVQAIVPQAGTYSLKVQAGAAPWEIEVQEYRAP